MPRLDGEIVLAPFSTNRGRRTRGNGRVETDPPTPPVTRYTHCPPGCDCPRCRIDQAEDAKLFAGCALFRQMAGETQRTRGYRTRAG